MSYSTRQNLALPLGVLGALTGCLTYVFFHSSGFMVHLAGAVYGLVVAEFLSSKIGFSRIRTAMIVVAFGFSWLAAFRLAILLTAHWELESLQATGVICGAVGASIVALGCALLIPSLLKMAFLVRTILLGALIGAFLVIGETFWSLLFFAVWQAAIAFSLGWELQRCAQQEGS